MLERQIVTLPFAAGLDTGTAPQLIQPPALKRLENGAFDLKGAINKRFGYTAMTKETAVDWGAAAVKREITKAITLAVSRDVLYMWSHIAWEAGAPATMAGDDGPWVVSATSPTDKWARVNPGLATALALQRISESSPFHRAPFIAGSADRHVIGASRYDMSSATASKAWADIVDGDTLTQVGERTFGLAPTVAESMRVKKAAKVGNYVLVFEAQSVPRLGTSGSIGIYMRAYDLTAPGDTDPEIGASPTLLASDFYGDVSAWDVVEVDDTHCLLVYGATGPNVRAHKVDATGILASATVAAGVSSFRYCMTALPVWNGATLRYWIFYADGAAGTVRVGLDSTLAVVVAVGVISLGTRAYRLAASRCSSLDVKTGYDVAVRIWIEDQSTWLETMIMAWDGTIRLGTAGGTYASQMKIASRAWEYEGQSYVWVASTTYTQQSYSLVTFDVDADDAAAAHEDVDGFRVVCNAIINRSPEDKTAPSGSGLAGRIPGVMPAVIDMGGGRYRTIALYTDRLESDEIESSSLAVLDVTMDVALHGSVRTPSGTVVGGGNGLVLSRDPVPIGFPEYPRQPQTTGHATTGGSITNGTRLYVAVFEWSDDSGRVYRSPPSIPTSYTFAGGTATQQLTIRVWPLMSWPASIDRTITRSKPKLRIHIYRTVAGGSTYYKLDAYGTENDTTIFGFLSFVDTVADTALVDNELLYTTGDLLDWSGCPPTQAITTTKRRLIVASADNPKLVYASGEFVPGEGAWFNDALTKELTEDVVALATLDGRTVVFHADSIGAIVGEWGNRAGYGQNLDYQELSIARGCSNARSVVATPAGVLFQSQAGLFLLDRSLQVQHIGEAVYSYERTEILRGVLHTSKPLALLFLADANVLAWDYERNQWAVWPLHEAVDAVMWQDKLTWAKSDGTVLVESTGFQDNGSSYSMVIGTGWYALGGIAGVERIYWVHLLGEYRSAHQLSVNVFYDHDDSAAAETHTITASADPQKMRFRPKRDRCSAIRFEIYDTPSGGTSEGWSATGIALELGTSRRTTKLGAAQTA